ncbi:glycosyltransferase [Shimia biformata]|uniref:glycosyltransferase n=1 Tax=Shimia biformata TaxID=1294299 RepID=UPI00194E87EC|nr:glycosyltransferase [Shimia biformata]
MPDLPPNPVLQTLLWPHPALCDDPALYARLSGRAEFAGSGSDHPSLRLGPGAEARFDSYANLFPMGKWQRHCALEHLALRLSGTGRVTVRVRLQRPAGDTDWRETELLCQELELNQNAGQNAETALDITVPGGFGPDDLIDFALTAQGPATLTGADWLTAQVPRRTPKMVLAITTFRREQAVRATVDRFERFITASPLADHLHLVVVDNGQTAEIAASDHVTPVANENLGGSGGFARGLLAARARGASHCLFMDDDASIHMAALGRTWAFLAYARDDRLAIAGALANAVDPWRLWENGAIFDRACRPAHIGMDLREPDNVRQLERDSAAPKPPNFYGGWWYFAFPVAAANHMPFPFFVRGDDISFCLVHDFTIVTLPGVISFQDENFANKESLQTLYLDLRSHLAHHMAVDHMDIGRRATLRIAMWFFARSLFQCHYETLEALNLSFSDFMEGPDFFAKNTDMAERRAKIAAMCRDEAWQTPETPLHTERRWINPDYRLVRWLMIASLNGHLIPFFRLLGNRVVLEAGMRGQLHRVWGAAEITYHDPETGKRFTLRHSKRRAAAQTLAFLRLSRRFWRGYDGLKRDWRAGYPALASTAFWTRRMGITAEGAPRPETESGA